MGGKGVRQAPFHLDLGKKVGNLDLGGGILQLRFGLRKKSWKFGFWGGGVFSNFGFGLRKKVGNLVLGGGYSPTSDLDLGKKVGKFGLRKISWKFGFGGVFSNFGFGLRKKSWGGVFSNFGFGLRKKSWKFGFWGGYSPTSDLDLGKKLEFGGGNF